MKAIPLRIDYSVPNHPYTKCDNKEATHLYLNLPGPLTNRIIPVMIGGTRVGTGNWTWNGDTERVTLKPSILTKGGGENGDHICHTFVNDGKVIFLDDCSHELKGQTLDLLEVEW